jgi:hypothetical protein
MKRNLLQGATTLKAVVWTALGTTTAKVGEVIDRLGYDSAILSVIWEAVSSAGASTIVPTLAEGATSSPVTAVTLNTALATATATTVAGIDNYHLDLRGLDRYIRLTLTPAIAGGGTVLAGATITLGDKNVGPVPSAVTIYKKA